MSTHVLTFWPALPVDETRRSMPSRLAWTAAIAVLAPVIVVAAAASLVDVASARWRRRLA